MMVMVEILIVVCAVVWQIVVWNRQDDAGADAGDVRGSGAAPDAGCEEKGGR